MWLLVRPPSFYGIESLLQYAILLMVQPTKRSGKAASKYDMLDEKQACVRMPTQQHGGNTGDLQKDQQTCYD